MQKFFIVMDIDGCISDDRHRLHLKPEPGCKDPDRYDAYNEAAHQDEPLNVASFQRILRMARREDLDVIFVTARPIKYRGLTENWLYDQFGIVDPVILMRPEGDMETSPVMKPSLLLSRGFAPSKVKLAYDDRDDVLQAYRNMGIEARRLDYATDAVTLRESADTVTRHWKSSVNDAVITEVTKTMSAAKAAIAPGPALNFKKSQAKVEADALLSQMAETYAERNANYHSNYRQVGEIMDVLHGLKAPVPAADLVKSVDDFTKWHLYELMIVKLTRFANSGLTHTDSIHDLAIYAAMVEARVKTEGHE